MSENGKNSYQRLKILYIYKILLEQTDEDNQISTNELIDRLSMYGIEAGRKAIYEDIEALRAFGLDIVSGNGVKAGYRVVSRDFELPELKILADAVTCSRFMTKKKSVELLKKIERLASVNEARQINRQVAISNRVKSDNENIYLSIDTIHRAIAEKKQIRFSYFRYNVRKRKVYDEELKVCSPYVLAWSDERYYLLAYYEKYDAISHFRVDRMDKVEILDESFVQKPRGFDASSYINSTFSMFSGKEEEVKLRFDNSIVNSVLDKFGMGVRIIPDGKEHFTVRVKVRTEKPDTFFGWLFGFGVKAEILAPEHLKESYRKSVADVMNNFDKC